MKSIIVATVAALLSNSVFGQTVDCVTHSEGTTGPSAETCKNTELSGTEYCYDAMKYERSKLIGISGTLEPTSAADARVLAKCADKRTANTDPAFPAGPLKNDAAMPFVTSDMYTSIESDVAKQVTDDTVQKIIDDTIKNVEDTTANFKTAQIKTITDLTKKVNDVRAKIKAKKDETAAWKEAGILKTTRYDTCWFYIGVYWFC